MICETLAANPMPLASGVCAITHRIVLFAISAIHGLLVSLLLNWAFIFAGYAAFFSRNSLDMSFCLRVIVCFAYSTVEIELETKKQSHMSQDTSHKVTRPRSPSRKYSRFIFPLTFISVILFIFNLNITNLSGKVTSNAS